MNSEEPKTISEFAYFHIFRYFFEERYYFCSLEVVLRKLREYINWPSIRPDGLIRTRGDEFHRYCKVLGHSRLSKKLDEFKRDMDETSCAVVEKILKDYIKFRSQNRAKAEEWYDYAVLSNLRDIDKKINSIIAMGPIPKHISPHSYPDIFCYESGLTFVPEEIVKRKITGKDILDCGAYFGDSAIVFHRMHKPKKIYSFEPEKANYARLLETIEFCGIKNAIAVNMGVGECKKIAGITPKAGGGSKIVNMGRGERTHITDIDSFVKKNGIVPGLIKMDIAGYELKALKGALKTIKKYRPILLIAIYYNPVNFFEIKPLLEKNLKGYRFLVRHIAYNHPTYETPLIGYPLDEEAI